MEDLLSVAKELLEDFDLYGSPVQLQVIAKLRRAVEAAQQGVHLTDGGLAKNEGDSNTAIGK